MLRKLLPYWWSSRRRTALGVTTLLAAASVELLLPWPVKWLVDYVLGARPPPEWLTGRWLGFVGDDRTAAVAMICFAGVLFAVLHRGMTLLSQMLLIGLGGQVVLQLRCRGYEQFCRLSVAYHDRAKVGDSL